MTKQTKRLRNQVHWLKVRNNKMRQELDALKVGKQAQLKNRMSPEFLAKVALSWPSTCARNFSAAWQDLVGVGESGCSRPTICKIRDAFVEVAKGTCVQQVKSSAAHALESAGSAPGSASSSSSAASLPCVAMLHIHDEACLRLRSSADTHLGAPSRSRSSKVQQHVVTVHFTEQPPVRWYAELDPLADKSAKTLATSLHKVLKAVSAALAQGFKSSADGIRPWFFHILVGDGVNTNRAAAKIILAWVRKIGIAAGLQYFLILAKCANHQTSLAVGSAVSGRAALSGMQNRVEVANLPYAQRCKPLSQQQAPHLHVCGAIVRCFKYLVSDYYTEYCANLQDIVGRLAVADPSPTREQHRLKWQGLSALYGEEVFPKGLLDCLNGDLADWSRCLSAVTADYSPGSATPGHTTLQSAKDALARILRSRILVVDEQPTLSRMFTFHPHLNCLLLLQLLGITPDLLQPRTTKPRDRNQKRKTKVLAFLGLADTPQYLKRTSLALQLLAHVQSLCAQSPQQAEPLLVQLAKGRIGTTVSADLSRLIGLLHLDPDLDMSATLAVLLSVGMELCIRFKEYMEWPFAGYKLCKKYNPDGYLTACMEFLQMPDEMLDTGLGIPLRDIATRAATSGPTRLQYLISEGVQQALELAFESSACSSLPVERAFAQTKRSEAPRLCHVATAGRNQIIRQFLRQRQELLEQAELASAALRRSMSTNIASLAWEMHPKLADSALQQAGSAEMREFIASNSSILKEEVLRRRSIARAAVHRTQLPDAPLTHSDWIYWFRRHQDDFFQGMKVAGDQRRATNRRLQASADAPPPVKRIEPSLQKSRSDPVPPWQKLLAGRSGWFLLKLTDQGLRLLFLLHFKGCTHCLDCSSWRRRRDYFIGEGQAMHLPDRIGLLESLEFGNVLQVVEVGVHVSAATQLDSVVGPVASHSASQPESAAFAPGAGQVRIAIRSARELSSPLPGRPKVSRKRKRRQTQGQPQAGSEDESCSSAEEEDDDILSLSSASSFASVDTDVDPAVDDYAEGKDGKQYELDRLGALDSEEEDQQDVDCAEVADIADGLQIDPDEQKRQRHPPGTRKIWEGTWVYATKTPGWLDIKCWINWQFRGGSSESLGIASLSRTLTPHHYGDDWNDPWRALLLLRAWSIWRVRWLGWARAKDCRLREVARQAERFIADLKDAHSEHGIALQPPLLGSMPGHDLLVKWTPDVVTAVLA